MIRRTFTKSSQAKKPTHVAILRVNTRVTRCLSAYVCVYTLFFALVRVGPAGFTKR